MPQLDHFKTSEIPLSIQGHQFSISLTRRTPRTDMGSNPKMIWLSNKLQCTIAINSNFTKRFFGMMPKSRRKFFLWTYACLGHLQLWISKESGFSSATGTELQCWLLHWEFYSWRQTPIKVQQHQVWQQFEWDLKDRKVFWTFVLLKILMDKLDIRAKTFPICGFNKSTMPCAQIGNSTFIQPDKTFNTESSLNSFVTVTVIVPPIQASLLPHNKLWCRHVLCTFGFRHCILLLLLVRF